MAITLTAVNCPPIVVPTGFVRLLDAETGTGTGVPVARRFVTGQVLQASYLNRNACEMDLIARYGGRGYCVLNGLTLSIGTGLALNVAAGQASIDGIVEIPVATTVTVPDATARVFVYLLQNGTLTYTTAAATQPVGASIFIGSVVTAGGVVTQVDTSGVMTSRGFILARSTADVGQPGDTPPASAAFISTSSDNTRWLWDGVGYIQLGAPRFYDVAQRFPGAIASGGLIFEYVASRPVTLPINFAGSVAGTRNAATAAVTAPVQKNGVQIGTMNFTAGATAGTFTVASQTSLVAGDILAIIGPIPADATWANVGVTLVMSV